MKLKLKVSHVYPPIPLRTFDWCVYVEGCEEGINGYGRTIPEAIDSFKEQYRDEHGSMPRWSWT